MSQPIDPKPKKQQSAEHEERQTPEVLALHQAAMREMSDPRDGVTATPVWLLMCAFFFAGWGGWYLASTTGGFHADEYRELAAGALKSGPEAVAPVDPMVLGKRVFNNCTQCHQDNGAGVAGTYPPLAGSEFVNGDPEVLARIVLHGLQGEVKVKGATYNGEMPFWNQLKDEQIAAVLTYVRSSFGNQSSAIDPAFIGKVRKDDAAHTQPMKAAELVSSKE